MELEVQVVLVLILTPPSLSLIFIEGENGGGVFHQVAAILVP